MLFSIRLRTLRNQHRMSREALAKMMGVTGQTVYRWETGMAQPNIQKLIALSELFSVTLDELCGKTAELDPDMHLMMRAYEQITAEERQTMLRVGSALFEKAFTLTPCLPGKEKQTKNGEAAEELKASGRGRKKKTTQQD